MVLACAAGRPASAASGALPAIPPVARLAVVAFTLCCAGLRWAALCRVRGGPHRLLWFVWQPRERHTV